jgi:rubrerythrin
MFTIREISALAVQIETNGEAVYRQVADKVTDPALKNLLEELVRDEQQHVRWFRRLGEGTVGGALEDGGELETMGRALLAEMLGQQTFSLSADALEDAATMAEVIAQAVEFEKDTIVFYEMLADFVEVAEVAAQLREIIAEEKAHIQRLNGFLKR